MAVLLLDHLPRLSQQAPQGAAAPQPPSGLLIVEAHVGAQDGALMAVAKGIQTVAGKAPAPPVQA